MKLLVGGYEKSVLKVTRGHLTKNRYTNCLDRTERLRRRDRPTKNLERSERLEREIGPQITGRGNYNTSQVGAYNTQHSLI